MQPSKQYTTKLVENMADNFGWRSYFSKRGEEDYFDVEFENYTDAGQDLVVSVIVPIGFTIMQLANALREFWESYDPDEEASLWIGNDGHGANGAPYRLSEILKDMNCAKKMIHHLYKRFLSKAKMKKYQNIIIVSNNGEED